MTRTFCLTLAALLAGTSPSAQAADNLSQATIADVRCIIVGSVMGSQEANAHSAAVLALYFLGRIDGRESAAFDLSKAMLEQMNLMSTTDFSAEGKRCGKELEGRGLYLADVGHKLTQLSGEQKQ
jgi:hypothetical protein